MKNLTHLMLSLAMLFVMAACSEQEDTTPSRVENDDEMVISQQEALAVGITSQQYEKFENHQYFRTRMKGSFEVPVVQSAATGVSLFKYAQDTSALIFILGVANIENVVAAHIHWAPAGENGSVVAFLFGGPTKEGMFKGVLNSGKIKAEDLIGPLQGMTIPDLVREIEMGNAYVNVHTLQNPGGEIRGQIR